MVRILNFENGSRWVARLRMTATDTDAEKQEASLLLQREVDCIQLVRERTNVPVPATFGYIADADNNNEIGAPLMLMVCLPGNVAMDLQFSSVPAQHKSSFYADMARFQVCLCSKIDLQQYPFFSFRCTCTHSQRQTEITSILFPKIGSIIRLPNGTYDVGPLPGLGGPFDTVTDYLRAWGQTAKFYHPISKIKEACGDLADEVRASTLGFPAKVAELATTTIPTRNQGPFPLLHPDFGHNNIVVDDNYHVLGVIDWEHASSMPWETVDFPLLLSLVPRLMDASWNYDVDGTPKDEGTRAKIEDRRGYVDAVKEVERRKGREGTLSAVLGDQAGQDLATAMRLYVNDGKMGFYSRVLDR